MATAQGGPCVVHPELLVIFGDRWQVWPQLPSDHPGFRVHNFFDRTYWDTFCLAAREVFEHHPYAHTAAEIGLGPEDWHWGMETVHAGIPHLSAPGTALLYRVKPTGSVQGGHEEAHSLLPHSPLLTYGALASHLPEDPRAPRTPRRGLQRAIVREARGQLTQPPAFNVLHYRVLNPDVVRLPNEEATRHYRDVGRVDGRRARLTDDELADVTALDLDDYRELHPDLAGFDDAGLLYHYVVHGRVEGRAGSMSAEQREARRPVVLDER